MIDKCRALLAGTIGEYKFDCPMDKRFLDFTGIKAAAFKRQVARGGGDGDILDWVKKHAKHQRLPQEIEAWSAWQERRAPDSLESRARFTAMHTQLAPKRTDIISWFDILDLDDHVSFGGKP
jgi:hypothetical protein